MDELATDMQGGEEFKEAMDSQIPEESRDQAQESGDEEQKEEAETLIADREEEACQEAKTTSEEEETAGLERVVTSIIREKQEREKEPKTAAPEPKSKTPVESPVVEISSYEPPSQKKRKRIPKSEPRVRSQRSAAGTCSRAGESKSRGDSVPTQQRYDSFFRRNFIDERRLLNPEEVYLAKSLLNDVNLLSSVTDVSSYDKKLLCEFWTGLPMVKTEEESVEVQVRGSTYVFSPKAINDTLRAPTFTKEERISVLKRVGGISDEELAEMLRHQGFVFPEVESATTKRQKVFAAKPLKSSTEIPASASRRPNLRVAVKSAIMLLQAALGTGGESSDEETTHPGD
ncbi:unnamed protein product [Cochlearia groenlandica]